MRKYLLYFIFLLYFSIDITSEKGHQENTCDITIKGHYRIDAASALLDTLTGGQNVSGDGTGKVKIGNYLESYLYY